MKKGKGLRRTITAALELPKEITLNLPVISIIGGEELTIENYKNVIEYTGEKVRINAASCVLKIEGSRLAIKHITSESMAVSGGIESIEFLR